MTNQFNVGDLVKGVGEQKNFLKGEVIDFYNKGEFVKLKVLEYNDGLFTNEIANMITKDFELYDV